MKTPWSVRGIPHDIRKIALFKSQRAGMTVGQWLTTVIEGKDNNTLKTPDLETLTPLFERLEKSMSSTGNQEDNKNDEEMLQTLRFLKDHIVQEKTNIMPEKSIIHNGEREEHATKEEGYQRKNVSKSVWDMLSPKRMYAQETLVTEAALIKKGDPRKKKNERISLSLIALIFVIFTLYYVGTFDDLLVYVPPIAVLPDTIELISDYIKIVIEHIRPLKGIFLSYMQMFYVEGSKILEQFHWPTP